MAILTNMKHLSTLLAFAISLVFLATSAKADDQLLDGCWSGSWQSCTTGHGGPLSASFCRIGPEHVQASFRGKFARILPFRYYAVLRIVHEEPGSMVLAGSQRLGPIMGTFEYQATIRDGNFQATYSSRRESGNWTLSR